MRRSAVRGIAFGGRWSLWWIPTAIWRVSLAGWRDTRMPVPALGRRTVAGIPRMRAGRGSVAAVGILLRRV